MLYAPSRSSMLVLSIDMGRDIEVEGGGGELEGVYGFTVGINLDATLQKSSKLCSLMPSQRPS